MYVIKLVRASLVRISRAQLSSSVIKARFSETLSEHGEPRTQFVVPTQYRHDICQKITETFERNAVDIVGPSMPHATDGSKYLFTYVDFSTRWHEAVALQNNEATTVAETLVGIFCHVGIPKDM